MVEVGGRDDDDNWKTVKVVCNSEEDVIAIVQEWNTLEVND
jgi:hypothetical protein